MLCCARCGQPHPCSVFTKGPITVSLCWGCIELIAIEFAIHQKEIGALTAS